MITTPTTDTAGRGPALLGQTVVPIGGSSGIGLETARQAHAEGAELVLAGLDRGRLEDAATELGAKQTAAFDATDQEASCSGHCRPSARGSPGGQAGRRTSRRARHARGPLVTFARSGIAAPFGDDWRSVLDIAGACDVPTRWSCRAGACHTCVTPPVSGDITGARIRSSSPQTARHSSAAPGQPVTWCWICRRRAQRRSAQISLARLTRLPASEQAG